MEPSQIGQFQNILLYQNATRALGPAFHRAVRLARQNEATLKVVDVVTELPGFFRGLLPVAVSDLDAICEARRQKLAELVSSAITDGDNIETDVLVGRPFVELIREVIDGRRDVFMKDAHADVADLFFGSLDLRLLRCCPVPVWLVKPHVPHKCERVVVAIDPEVNFDGQEVNERITQLAMSICDHDKGKLSVVSVWRKPWDALEANDEYREDYEQFEHHVEAAARNTLDQTLKKSGAVVPAERIVFESGRPSEIISQVVDKVDADLLVMGTIARTGVSGLLLGNTAEKVLRMVQCSVLTVKPEGFVSPIEAEFSNNA